MSKKSLRSIGTLTLAFLLLTTLAFATSGLSAWCIVPALNGSANSEDTGVKETTGSSAYLEGVSRMFAGHEVYLQFSNNLTTPVRVEVNGSWDSN